MQAKKSLKRSSDQSKGRPVTKTGSLGPVKIAELGQCPLMNLVNALAMSKTSADSLTLTAKIWTPHLSTCLGMFQAESRRFHCSMMFGQNIAKYK